MESIQSLFEQMSEKSRFAEMLECSGSPHKLRDFIRQHENCEHLPDDQMRFVQNMMDAHQIHPRKSASISVLLERNFQADKFFEAIEQRNPEFEKRLWNFYAREPIADTAKAAAILVAEYIRYKILTTGKTYELPLDALFANASDRTKESILAIQNALVEYVANEGPNLALNRGGAMLKILAEDLDGSELWTRKLSDIQTKSGYHPVRGDVFSMKPVFG